MGYTNVKVFTAGYPAWMKVKGNYASVSVDFVKKQIDSNADMVVVDARPKRKKYDKGHIPTAISIPDTQFDDFRLRVSCLVGGDPFGDFAEQI